jgi:exodeoxyribonuclease V alpha subunit
MITCHKTQGSQYSNIIVYLSSSWFILNRNFLYTALSRATKNIILIGDEEQVNYTIRKKINRKTLLKKMIIFYNKKTKYENFIDYFLKN